MNEHLVALHNRALSLKASGKPAEAAVLYEQLLEEQPRWEHGYGAFALAQCYEDQGKSRPAMGVWNRESGGRKGGTRSRDGARLSVRTASMGKGERTVAVLPALGRSRARLVSFGYAATVRIGKRRWSSRKPSVNGGGSAC
jgi:hypothetical protein